jgi:hypothetical protein
MAVDEDEEDDTDGDVMNGPQDVVLNDGELEVGENDEDDDLGMTAMRERTVTITTMKRMTWKVMRTGTQMVTTRMIREGVGAATRNLHAAVTMTRRRLWVCFTLDNTSIIFQLN